MGARTITTHPRARHSGTAPRYLGNAVLAACVSEVLFSYLKDFELFEFVDPLADGGRGGGATAASG
jgi:hypothetical protein